MKYEHLSEEQQKSIAGSVKDSRRTAVQPEINDALLAAWEADHYGHSLHLEEAKRNKDEEAIATHQQAMTTIEEALKNARASKPKK